MTTATPAGADAPKKGAITVASATAIGVGGMMGAGLYTLVGLAATTAGVWIPVAFLVGGFVSLFSVYSYAKLGAKFPSRGGAAAFLIRCFGDGLIAGGLNIFQFLGWIIAMALYAAGFAGYARDLLPFDTPDWSGKVIGVALVVVLVGVNMIGSKLVGRSELFVIGIELAIIAIFVVASFFKADPDRFHQVGGDGVIGILFAAGLLYVTYEGFGVVTNSAGDMKNPAKELPRAMYQALAIVIVVYVLVSALIVMLLPLSGIVENQGHVFAEAGRAALGHVGFVVIGAAALLATASGVNATLFGDANLAFTVAKEGEMPEDFARGVWHSGTWGLLIAGGLTCAFVVFFPLSAVGQMASLAFLIVYGTVSLGHLRLADQTGAKRWLLWLAVILNLALFCLLLGYAIHTGPASTWITLLVVLVFSFVAEYVYRRITGRHLTLHPPRF
ncbi:amino acid:proton symporter (ABT family) [Branchiibius hedensis]|uniref:L-asparagine transporter n=1 Tax=Branchiibius hedensis TaxID=672460 RepID=A0A2Y9BUE3_9MICO|nr:APC family permease [Branchiibius hedensis]PWJ26751.1 amino acid:proton symporter (ABT family) [Branchiibius hedensis]SSA35562.1 L-asparagine transporter [Branchiibius hedensis]